MISYKGIKTFMQSLKGQSDEIVWAKVWDDTRKGIAWLDNIPSISPGRWAVGYNYIYVITRILNEMKPQRILDLGLGISSTIISQYCDCFLSTEGCHDVVEQDESWIEFYLKHHSISKYTHIHPLESLEKDYKGHRINYYKCNKSSFINRSHFHNSYNNCSYCHYKK